MTWDTNDIGGICNNICFMKDGSSIHTIVHAMKKSSHDKHPLHTIIAHG